jgi:hypothetical protein
MAYGRNFEFRVPPRAGQRGGRYAAGASTIVIGAPVKATGAEDTRGRLVVNLATGAQAPVPGICGVAVYEYKGEEGWATYDPYLTTYSDLDFVPALAGMQVVAGDTVKFLVRNTVARTFLNTRSYTGRKMVAGLGATLTLQVGDYLTPGTGDDTNGYWAETAVFANAWAVITKVDNTRGEVEARMLF